LSGATPCADTGLTARDDTGDWKCDAFQFDPYGDVKATEIQMAAEQGVAPAPADKITQARRVVVSMPPGFRVGQPFDVILSLHGKGGNDIISREFFLLSSKDGDSRFKYGQATGTSLAMARQEEICKLIRVNNELFDFTNGLNSRGSLAKEPIFNPDGFLLGLPSA